MFYLLIFLTQHTKGCVSFLNANSFLNDLHFLWSKEMKKKLFLSRRPSSLALSSSSSSLRKDDSGRIEKGKMAAIY